MAERDSILRRFGFFHLKNHQSDTKSLAQNENLFCSTYFFNQFFGRFSETRNFSATLQYIPVSHLLSVFIKSNTTYIYHCCSSLQSISKNNGIKKDLLSMLSQKHTKDETEFLKKLISFMERRETPIERPPMLGYKQSEC